MELFIKSLFRKPIWFLGLLQALGVVVYILLFATAAFNIAPNIHANTPVIGAAIVLTAFVTSALICGSLILGLPAIMAIKGQIKNAVLLLVWSTIWLGAILFSAVITLAGMS